MNYIKLSKKQYENYDIGSAFYAFYIIKILNITINNALKSNNFYIERENIIKTINNHDK